MTTPWTLPTIVSQYAEEGAENIHIQWNSSEFNALKNLDQQCLGLDGVLEHIARSPKPDFKNKSYFLRITGFNFINLPENVNGIEVRLSARRSGRIVDDTIQLCLDNNLIGDNQATAYISPLKIYGSENSLWGLENISKSDLQQSSFGVIVRFQSHPNWPHKDAAFIDAVEIRIH